MIAGGVEDEVVLLLAFGEVFPGVVDDVIRAERAHELDVSRAAYTGDFGAPGFRDLHGVGSHAAGGAIDEHLLSGGDATVIAQALQRGDGGDRYRGGLLERDFSGLQDNVAVLTREHVFGERAARPAEDFIARL